MSSFFFAFIILLSHLSTPSQALDFVSKFSPTKLIPESKVVPLLIGHQKSLFVGYRFRNLLIMNMYRVESGVIRLEAELSIHLNEKQMQSCQLRFSDLAFDRYAIPCQDEVLVFTRDSSGVWVMTSLPLSASFDPHQLTMLKSSFVVNSLRDGFLIFDDKESRFFEFKSNYSSFQRWGDEEILAVRHEKSLSHFSVFGRSQQLASWVEKPLFTDVPSKESLASALLFKAEKPYFALGAKIGKDYEVFLYKASSGKAQVLPKLRFSQVTYPDSTQLAFDGEKLFVSQPYFTSDKAKRWTGMIEEFAPDSSGNQFQSISRFVPGDLSREDSALGQSLASAGGYLFASTPSFKSLIDQFITNPAEVFVLKPSMTAP